MTIARYSFHMFCLFLFIMSIVKISNADQVDVQTHTTSTIEKLASELQSKNLEIVNKEKQLVDRERKLDEREKDLDKKISELKQLQEGINASLDSKKKDNEQRVDKMVQIFETMQPKAASQLMETIDDWLAVDVLSRLETKKAAKMMNLMDKSRSAKLTELLTGYFRARDPASNGSAENAHGASSQVPVASEDKASASKTGTTKQ